MRAAWLGVAALTILGVLVFWGFPALPFQDLPGHAGFIALRHHARDWTALSPYVVLALRLGPYTLFRALGELFVVPLGPVGAVRAIATLPVLATPAALAWGRRRLHGDRAATAAFVGLALSFGFLTLLGLAGYLLGVALALLALTVWLELLAAVDAGSPGARATEIAVGGLALVVLVAHGFAFAVLVALAVASAASAAPRAARLVRLRALAPAVALAAFFAFRDRASSLPPGSVDARNPALLPRFEGPLAKLSLLLTPTLMTRWGVDAAAGVLLWALLGAASVATARALRTTPDAGVMTRAELASRGHARALLVCMAVVAAAFVAAPHAIGWLAFVDGRLVPWLLLLATMATRREALGPRLARALDRGTPLAATVVLATALLASWRFQAEASGWGAIESLVPAGARLLHLPVDPDSDVFTAHPFVHYDKLVLAERPVLVSDAWLHQGTGVYPTAANPSVRLPASYVPSDMTQVDWPSYRLDDWDYVLLRMRPAAPAIAVPAALSLVAHEGGFWLYRGAASPSSQASHTTVTPSPPSPDSPPRNRATYGESVSSLRMASRSAPVPCP